MPTPINDLSGSVTTNPLPPASGLPPGWIGGPTQVAPPVFDPTPGLPAIPGGQTTVTGTNARPTYGPPPPASPTSSQVPLAPVGGPNFNLQNLINTFPGVNDALGLEQRGISQLDANLNQARQQAIINFGDPALAGLAGFGLDPQAGAFAQQNYLSGNATMARLDKQHQLAAQSVINQLASHGLLNSGDLGYQEGQENQGYGNSVYDAQQNVLQQLADLYNNYLSSRYGLESNANSAQLQALQAFLANPDAYATLTSGASTQPGATSATVPKVAPPKVKQPADAISRYLSRPA